MTFIEILIQLLPVILELINECREEQGQTREQLVNTLDNVDFGVLVDLAFRINQKDARYSVATVLPALVTAYSQVGLGRRGAELLVDIALDADRREALKAALAV